MSEPTIAQMFQSELDEMDARMEAQRKHIRALACARGAHSWIVARDGRAECLHCPEVQIPAAEAQGMEPVPPDPGWGLEYVRGPRWWVVAVVLLSLLGLVVTLGMVIW